MMEKVCNGAYMETAPLAQMTKFVFEKYQDILGKYPSSAHPTIEDIIEDIIHYYEGIISCMPGNVYWLSSDGIAIGCNQNVLNMFGLKSRAEFKGMSFEDMGRIGGWSPDAERSFKNDTLEVVRTGEPRLNIEEPPIPHADGRIIYFLTSRVPLKDHLGNVIGIVGISIDITERKRYEEELNTTLQKLTKALEAAEEANRAKFNLAIINHELTNFVGSVQSSLDLIKMLIPNPSENLNKYFNICTESLNHIMPFIQDVTKYFQIEGSGINSKIGLAKITDTINIIIANQKELYKNTEVEVDVHPGLKNEILIDNLNFFKVLTIVIGNAFRFSNKGKIYINAYPEQNNLLIVKVKDTGKGMYPEQLKNIFNAFPMDKDINVRYKKFGLKLSIAKKIIELLGGTINIESKINIGTTVTISLPVSLPDIKTEEFNNTAPNTQENDNIEKILVVEDDKRTCELIVSLLTALNSNFYIDSVETGTEAIEKAESNKYDLIFLDITLPDISGVEVIENLQRILTKPVPIAAVTSHASEEAIDDFLSKGFIYVIPKPISIGSFKQFFNDLPKLMEED